MLPALRTLFFFFNQFYEYSSGDFFFLVQMSLKPANWQSLKWLDPHLLQSSCPSLLIPSSIISHLFCWEYSGIYSLISEILLKFHGKEGGIKRHGSKYVQCLFMHHFIFFISIFLNFSLHELVFVFVVVAIAIHI